MRIRSRIETVRARIRPWRAQVFRPPTVGRHVRFGPHVRIGGNVMIGDEVEIGGGTSLFAHPGSIRIGAGTFISSGCVIAARDRIVIGPDSMFAELVTVRDHDHDPDHAPKSGKTLIGPVEIGARVWIGSKATIVRGVTIGDDAVIGANAVVTHDVEPGSIVGGVPARFIRFKKPSP